MSSYNDYQHWPQESTSNSDEDELSSPEIEQDDSDDDSESSTSSTSSSGTSSSGSSQSGSDSESTSTAEEDETKSLKTETVIANKTELSLPTGMCEDEGVFKQLFSVNSWVCLSDVQKQHLKNFLPTFSENDLMEKEITLRMLFGGQSFRFGVNPINEFHDKLKNGHFRPDIVKMKSLLRRSLKREYRKSQRIYNYNMLKKLISGRKKVINDLISSSTTSVTNSGDNNSFNMHQQVKRRYFQEVSDIKELVGDVSEDSSDSNYQEGPPTRLGKKQRRNLSTIQSSLSPELEIITSTLATFPDRIDLSKVALPTSNPFEPSDDMYKEMLISHKRKKKKMEQQNKRMRYEQIKEHIKPEVSLGTVEKKKSANSDRLRLKRTKPVKHQNQSTPAPKLPLQLDVQPPVQFDVNIPVPSDVNLPAQLDVQSPVKLSTQPQVQLDAQPQVQLDVQPQVHLNVQSHKQIDAQSQVQLDVEPHAQVDVQPTTQLDMQPSVQLDESHNISSKQEDRTQTETCSNSYVKEEILQNVVSPPLLSPSSISLSNMAEEESIKTNLNAIKLDPCTPILTDFLKMEEEITLNDPIKLEPISLTAEEIRKAEEGQAAAAMLLEQMSDVEEKYNPPLIPSPPLPSPPPSPPSSPPPPSSSDLSPPQLPENISDSKFSPPNYIQREFHPEDMLTSTVQTINTESPPTMIHSCLRSLTPSDFGSKQLSLSPVSTPSKVITDSNYVGSLSELEGFHVLDIKTMCNEDLDLKTPQIRKMVSSFFALIRDIICANWDYRMDMTALNERVNDWVISTFNNRTNPDWYHSLTLKTWPKSLQSAIGFLAGHFPEWQPEDFVPYIEYKPSLDIYQWIGAGRDSDTRLGDLCKCWLHNLNNISSKLKSINDDVIGIKNVPIPSTTDIISSIEMSETDSTAPLSVPLLETWIVTPSNDEERAIFQAQEKQRFLKPHRSFVYQMHGYESVVGPVRGIYNSSNIHKAARGHSLLIENRPHFISILVLVRDATARLPNGMGTRSDICTLLKDSQYLMEANLTELHNAVSGALDRLHYEHDPCVKYDPKRKIWIYLHRGRKLEEFERLHLEQQGAVKMKCWRRNKTPKKPPEPKRTPNKKSTSNVLLDSLSMLDLPTSSTSDSMPSSSTSPVLSDIRVTQEMTNIDHSKQLIKSPRVTKNRKVPPIQTMQMTDNAVELNIECPTLIDQNSTVSSQIFSMPVSSHISTVTASNSSIISSNNISNQSFSSNITSHSIISSNSQSITNSFTCQSIANNINNISSQSIAGNILSQTKAGNSLKVVSSQAVSNSGQMINISQTMNSNNQTFINNNKMVVNNISSNKPMISSGDLITIGPRKKTKHVQIAQPISIGQSSGLTNYQHDHHLNITKSPQIKEHQRQILVLKQKRSDHSISSSEQNTTVVSQTDTLKPQILQQYIHLQNQQKFMNQQQNMHLKLMQQKQIQQQTLQQNKQQVIIRKTDGDDKTETVDAEQPQVIFLKQGPRNVQQQETQQITQQQLQQLLMLRPQQQTGQQAQVVMVKQQGNDQKSIALKPILTSLRGTKTQQTPTKTANLLVQAKQATQNVQRKITKPLVGKFVSNQRAQLPVDSVLANRKLSGVPGTPLRISGVQTSKSGQPHYTVVTVAQPKLMPSNQPNIGQKTPARISTINDRLKSGDTNQPQTVRVVQSQIGGKPLLVTNKVSLYFKSMKFSDENYFFV
uniref:Nuclear factor related to kappa-B-binding protein n=1 Tax=Melanaphis sacchari TaxID=742174 RepID=A0A2H8TJP8_9HEMI